MSKHNSSDGRPSLSISNRTGHVYLFASRGLKVKCKKVELCGSKVPSKGFTARTSKLWFSALYAEIVERSTRHGAATPPLFVSSTAWTTPFSTPRGTGCKLNTDDRTERHPTLGATL
eukprot:Skav233472  [mRNA]  locus=scaffold3626:31472:33256:- [translate_table: standard]